jgi:hypothetical protein
MLMRGKDQEMMRAHQHLMMRMTMKMIAVRVKRRNKTSRMECNRMGHR